MLDPIENLFRQARAIRMAAVRANSINICGFTYEVQGSQVIRYNPNGTADFVVSPSELNDSLTPYQKALLEQNNARLRKKRSNW